jgi:hypothetical protein
MAISSGKTESERQVHFLVLFSGMAGALGLARAVVDAGVRHQILQAARKFYLASFADNKKQTILATIR